MAQSPFKLIENSRKEEPVMPEPSPARWTIGVDRRRAVGFVVIAFAVGVVCGYFISQYQTARKPQAAASMAERMPSPAERTPAQPMTQQQEVAARFYRVNKILSGSAVEVEGAGRVNLAGLEVPDAKSSLESTARHGQSALSEIKALLSDAEVRLEFDSGVATAPDGARPAYVYRRDGLFINGEMLRKGLALAKLDGLLSLSNELRASEREAIEAKRGLWAEPVTDAKSSPLAPLSPSAIGPNLPASLGTSISQEPVVYAGIDGRYHNKAACDMIEGKKRTITVSSARSEGYSPCSRCYPSPSQKVP